MYQRCCKEGLSFPLCSNCCLYMCIAVSELGVPFVGDSSRERDADGGADEHPQRHLAGRLLHLLRISQPQKLNPTGVDLCILSLVWAHTHT